jgi:hypothetical protein
MPPELPLRNDGETSRPCAICGTRFQPVGRQHFCKPACRQAAWRRRHPTPLPAVPAACSASEHRLPMPLLRQPLPR